MSKYRQTAIQELEPPIPIKQAMKQQLLPISESNYYDGVAKGRYPQPIRIGHRNFCTPSMLRQIREGTASS